MPHCPLSQRGIREQIDNNCLLCIQNRREVIHTMEIHERKQNDAQTQIDPLMWASVLFQDAMERELERCDTTCGGTYIPSRLCGQKLNYT